MEHIKKAAKQLDKEIAMLKLRFWGDKIVNIILAGALIYVLSTERIYVTHPKGGIWEATPETRTNPEILAIEADDHIRKFYATFLSFNHIDMDKQIPKAYPLGGNIIKEMHAALKKREFYNEIMVNNYRVTSEVKNCVLKGIDGNSLYLEVTGEMVLENEFIREVRNMNMNVTLVVVGRVPIENPHGLSIENIKLPDGATTTISKENL
jgi:hypothetical protein